MVFDGNPTHFIPEGGTRDYIVIGPMGPDPVPFFASFFLAYKEVDWIKAQPRLGTINVRKINNSFRFIDDLLSLNDDSTFEKHYKDIYPTKLELKK